MAKKQESSGRQVEFGLIIFKYTCRKRQILHHFQIFVIPFLLCYFYCGLIRCLFSLKSIELSVFIARLTVVKNAIKVFWRVVKNGSLSPSQRCFEVTFHSNFVLSADPRINSNVRIQFIERRFATILLK